MRISITLLVTFIVIIMPCLTGCDDDNGDSGTGPNTTYIANEQWDAVVDGGVGSGSWHFKMKTDSSVVVDGQWIYNLGGEDVVCPFTNGDVEIEGNDLSFTADGVAAFVNLPTMNSAFTLGVGGTTDQGESNGDYTISFSASGWPASQNGTYTAERTDGGGITQ